MLACVCVHGNVLGCANDSATLRDMVPSRRLCARSKGTHKMETSRERMSLVDDVYYNLVHDGCVWESAEWGQTAE